jgi:hypothetical protein
VVEGETLAKGEHVRYTVGPVFDLIIETGEVAICIAGGDTVEGNGRRQGEERIGPYEERLLQALAGGHDSVSRGGLRSISVVGKPADGVVLIRRR